MSAVITAALMNAAGASVLACLIALVCRWVKRPAAVHVLWLLVLLELLGPPVFRVGVVPRPAEQVASVSPRVAKVPATLGPAPASVAPLSVRRVAVAALGLWSAGTVVLLSLTWVRGRRFARLLAAAASPSPCLEERVSKLARRMGLSRCPRVRLVAARISPMLRPRLGRVELLFPAGLLARLDEFERDTLLAHELAHVRRRDHWVRYLELTAVVLFWWHPVVWWTRARLRRAEEQACDGWVVQTIPARSRAYARALVKTVEFLAGAERPLPALASGLGEVRHLKERLTMIVRSSSTPSLSRPSRAALALAALAAVLIFPTWAEPPAEDPGAASGDVAEQDADALYRESVMQLEQEAAELQTELRGVHARRMEIEREWQQRHVRERTQLQQDIERQIEQHLKHAVAETEEREHELQAARLQAEIELMRAAESEDRHRSRREIEALLREASELDARGGDEQAQEIRALIEKLLQSLGVRFTWEAPSSGEDDPGTVQ